MRDPRVRDVTVVGVKVTPDMREATVAVSVMGDETQQRLTLRGLQNAAGFLQSKIANRIDTRYTPRLTFKIDKGIQHSLAVGEILAKIQREKENASDETDPNEALPERASTERASTEPASNEPPPSDEPKPE